jgi:hypothetical protein
MLMPVTDFSIVRRDHTATQEVVESDRTRFHTMVLLSADASSQISRHGVAHVEYRNDFSHACVTKVLERHGRASANIAWSDATACCDGERLGSTYT